MVSRELFLFAGIGIVLLIAAGALLWQTRGEGRRLSRREPTPAPCTCTDSASILPTARCSSLPIRAAPPSNS